MEHMRIATVRELRSRYSSLLAWIGAGEEVLITRRGRAVARLVPEQSTTEALVDWAQSPAVRRVRPRDKRLGVAASRALLQEASGSW